MSLFKLKMKILLFLVGSIVSFSGQEKNSQMNKASIDLSNHENYLISAKATYLFFRRPRNERSV